MKRFPTLLLLISLAVPAYSVQADENLEKPPQIIKEETPPAELMDQDKEHLPQPKVRIIKRDDATIEEYRVNGMLRYAKITPTSGPAYYLVDTDGDGQLDSRHDDLTNPPVQQWILYQW